MLGRLEMSIDECIEAYTALSDRVFPKQRHRVKVDGQMQGRFDTIELERFVKEQVAKKEGSEDALFKQRDDTKCKVYESSPRVECTMH